MALKHVILAILSRTPATGYDIVKAFDESLGFFWSATHQQIYRDLKLLADQRLVDFTLVEQQERPDKKRYRLTEAGERELRQWFEEPAVTRVNNDLLVRLLAIETVGRDAVIAMLADQAAMRRQRLAEYRAIERLHFANPRALPAIEQMIYLALRRGILGEEDWLRWIDEAMQVLAE